MAIAAAHGMMLEDFLLKAPIKMNLYIDVKIPRPSATPFVKGGRALARGDFLSTAVNSLIIVRRSILRPSATSFVKGGRALARGDFLSAAMNSLIIVRRPVRNTT